MTPWIFLNGVGSRLCSLSYGDCSSYIGLIYSERLDLHTGLALGLLWLSSGGILRFIKRLTLGADSWPHWPFGAFVNLIFVVSARPCVVFIRESDVTHGCDFLEIKFYLLILNFSAWILYCGPYWCLQKSECYRRREKGLLGGDVCRNQDRFSCLCPFLPFLIRFSLIPECCKRSRS